jgi:hypothetical protein
VAEPALSAADRHLYERELEAILTHEDLHPEEREDLRENLLARFVQAKDEETRLRRELVGQVVIQR